MSKRKASVDLRPGGVKGVMKELQTMEKAGFIVDVDESNAKLWRVSLNTSILKTHGRREGSQATLRMPLPKGYGSRGICHPDEQSAVVWPPPKNHLSGCREDPESVVCKGDT